MIARRVFALAALVLSCSAAAHPRPAQSPASAPTDATPRQVIDASTPDSGALGGFAPEGAAFAPGPCGGFEALELGDPMAALSDRVVLRPPRGMRVAGIGASSVMSAALSQQRVDRASLDAGDGRMVFTFDETFRRPGPRMLATLREAAREGDATLRAWRNAAGLRVVMTAPRHPDTHEEAVSVAEAWVALPDDLIVAVQFYVNPAAARRAAGCPALAQSVLETLAAGRRVPSLTARTLSLDPGLTLRLGADMVHSADRGPDFTVNRVETVSDLGSPSGELGLYLGHHPQHRPRDGATDVPGTLLGQTIQWSDSTDAHGHFRQSWVEVPGHPGLIAHVFFHALDPETFARLSVAAESLAQPP